MAKTTGHPSMPFILFIFRALLPLPLAATITIASAQSLPTAVELALKRA